MVQLYYWTSVQLKTIVNHALIIVQYVCAFFREKMDFVSKNVQGKLAIRAVLLGDMKLLNSLIEDKDNVYKVRALFNSWAVDLIACNAQALSRIHKQLEFSHKKQGVLTK